MKEYEHENTSFWLSTVKGPFQAENNQMGDDVYITRNLMQPWNTTSNPEKQSYT